ncbi:MAG: hypothetical protein WC840_04965 [Candidatus Peribacteraceae bacterium]
MPIFDGREYYNCLVNAAGSPFDLRNFICFDHPSFLFIGILAIPLYFFPGQVAGVHVMLMLLGSISIIALGTILKILIPEKSWWPIRSLVSLMYATQPVIIANALSLNLDIGVLFFFLPFLAFLLRGRDGWAALFGILMIFTKEAGLIAWCLAIALYTLVFIAPLHEVKIDVVSTMLKRRWLLIPFILSGLYVWAKTAVWHANLFYGVSDNLQISGGLNFSLGHRFYTLLLEFFTFQFLWIQSLIIAIAAVMYLFKYRLSFLRLRSMNLPVANTLFLALFLFGGMYLFTRGVAFNNLRYMLLLFPIEILLFAVSLRFVVQKKSLVTGCLFLVILLNFYALFRSNDPVSQRLIGTFSFGSHQMYSMSSVTQDGCCGFGRDQLVYNLEYLKFIELQEKAFQWIRPDADTYIAMNDAAHWSFSDSLDGRTFRFTEDANGIRPKFVSVEQILKTDIKLPETVFFISFPNFNNVSDIKDLRKRYDLAKSQNFDIDGYRMQAYEFRLHPATDETSP